MTNLFLMLGGVVLLTWVVVIYDLLAHRRR